MFRSGEEKYKDSLIPKDQHPVLINFGIKFEVLGDLTIA